MFKRMIVAVITFAALLCWQAPPNVEAAKPDMSLQVAIEFDELARNTDNLGNGNGRPEKPDVQTLKPVEPRPPVTEQSKPPTTSETVNQPQPINTFADTYNPNDTWLIQWYICGTDLESRFGSATTDIQELLKVKLPANVNVLIQTGGSKQWQNDVINSEEIGRYLYNSEGLYRLEILSDADMGNVNTLTDFVRFGQQYDADHRVFVFWDHGGGSVIGLCRDGRTGNSLSLNDLTQAFGSVYGAESNNPPFEMIGFDTCLMATYDTINALDGFARYVVASEETEPLLGWNYESWVGSLANNPAMNGARLGKEICDSYISACLSQNLGNKVTMSVVDMTKLPQLRSAYESFGTEALVKSYKNPQVFFSSFGRAALKAENYANDGGNYSHMIDIADLARKNEQLLSVTSNALINSVNSAVIYKVHGVYRNQGGGISSFYPYTNDENFLKGYINLQSAPIPQKFLYFHRIYGYLPDEIKPTLEQLSSQVGDVTDNEPVDEKTATDSETFGRQALFDKAFTLDTPPAQRQDFFDLSSLKNLPVQVDGNGDAFVTLTQEQMNLISSVQCILIYKGENNLIFLGSDADIKADWKTGVFKDNFRNVWPMIDGHPAYVEIMESNDGYNLYSIPIKLNGVRCFLQVAYIYADKKYQILGATRGLDENGMSYRDLIQLKAGDEITTIHYIAPISGDDNNFDFVEIGTFTVSENTTVSDTTLGDGEYFYLFEFVSPDGDSTMSKTVMFTVQDGKITTSVNNGQ